MATVELSAPFSSPLKGRADSSLWQSILSSLKAEDLAVDLGTANTLVYMKDFGIVVNEPSVVAVDQETGKPVAVGAHAKRMFGKTSRAIRCIRPMKDGVIADFRITTLMISTFLAHVHRRWSLLRPRVVVGVPSEITQVEKRAVIDAVLHCGAKEVLLVEESMAAALGAGLPIDRPISNMIVDIGGGTTDVAIIASHATLYSQSIRVAGDEMDEAIQRAMQRELGLQIGIFEAERIKMVLGSAMPLASPRSSVVYARDITSGCPRQVEISDEFLREALEEPISAIVSSVCAALEQATPEIAQDVAARGIHVTGGGSLLKGLTQRLEHETGIRFYRTTDPLSCVVRGVGTIVDNLREMRAVCLA